MARASGERRDAAATADEQDSARYIDVDRLVLEGWITYEDGDPDAAIAHLTRNARPSPGSYGARFERHIGSKRSLLRVESPTGNATGGSNVGSCWIDWPRSLGGARSARGGRIGRSL